DAMHDPFEYLMLRHRAGKLRTDFARSLGKVSYHVACHLRVQNIGLKTRETLALVPDTTIEPIERCSGHDGTYGVKSKTYEPAPCAEPTTTGPRHPGARTGDDQRAGRALPGPRRHVRREVEDLRDRAQERAPRGQARRERAGGPERVGLLDGRPPDG